MSLKDLLFSSLGVCYSRVNISEQQKYMSCNNVQQLQCGNDSEWQQMAVMGYHTSYFFFKTTLSLLTCKGVVHYRATPKYMLSGFDSSD